MTKQEFEERAGIKVSDSQYKKIETVYAFHPSIDEVAGKDQIAYLYKTFGMRVILDMLPTAEEAAKLESLIRQKQSELAEATAKLANLKWGADIYE